jgi:MFS family permease
MLLLNIALCLGMLVVIMMATLETQYVRRHRGIYLFRRLTLRLSMAGMLLFLLASILIGLNVRIFGLTEPMGVDWRWVAFWGSVVLLIGAICCLALADLTMIKTDVLSEHVQRSAEIDEIIANHREKPDE